MPDNCHFVNFDRWAEKGNCQLFMHIRGRCNTLQLSRRESDCTRIVTMVAKPLFLVLGDSHGYYLERFVALTEVGFAPETEFVREGLDCLLYVELPAVVVLCVAGNVIDTAPAWSSPHT